MGFWAMAGPAITKGAGSIAQAFTQAAQHAHEKRLNERTISAQKEMAEYQYGKDLEQWHRANLYNTPVEQMERLREAKLNPNLVYGSGAGQSVATQSPKYQAPRPEYDYAMPVNPLQMLGAYQDFQIKNAQIDNLAEQRKILHNEGQIKLYEAEGAPLYYTSRAQRQRIGEGREELRLGVEQEPGKGYRELYKTQLGYQKESVRKRTREVLSLDKRIENQKLVNEWYVTNLLGKLGIGFGNMVTGGLGKLIPRAKMRGVSNQFPKTPTMFPYKR